MVFEGRPEWIGGSYMTLIGCFNPHCGTDQVL